MPTKLNLLIKEEAEFDILNAYQFYEKQQLNLGNRFIYELEKVLNSILKSPNGFEKKSFYRQVPIKKFPYVVLYEEFDSEIVVYAVFQTKQNPTKKERIK